MIELFDRTSMVNFNFLITTNDTNKTEGISRERLIFLGQIYVICDRVCFGLLTEIKNIHSFGDW